MRNPRGHVRSGRLACTSSPFFAYLFFVLRAGSHHRFCASLACRHTSFMNTIKKLMRGLRRAGRDRWKNGWTLPMLCGPRSLVSMGSGMSVVTMAIVESVSCLWLARKYWAGSLSIRNARRFRVKTLPDCVRVKRTNIKTTVVVSGPFQWTVLHSSEPLPSPHPVSCPVGGATPRGLGYWCDEGQVFRVSNDIDRDQQAQRCGLS